jgi:MFS family permease
MFSKLTKSTVKNVNSRETKKTMTVVSLASFLNDFGSDMIYPIWPLFVLSFVGVDMAILGFIDGLGDAVVSISQAISGYFSDRIGKRKIFIWTGYLFGSTSRLGYAISTIWQHLVPFRILDRSGKMRGAPRDAIVADVSTNENRGRNFGLLRAMDNLGAVCGIITCILLINFLGYTDLFLLASIPSIIAAILVIMFIKDKKTEKIFKGISFKDLTFNFKLFLLLSAIFAIGSFSYSFMLIFAELAGFTSTFVPVLYLVFTVVAALMSLPFGKLADIVGRRLVLILSYVVWALMCAGFILIESLIGIALLFVLYGLHKGAIEPVQRALVSELSPERYRASMLGAFQLVVGVCALPASVIAGFLWVSLGKFAPFTLSLGLASVATVLLLFVKEKR